VASKDKVGLRVVGLLLGIFVVGALDGGGLGDLLGIGILGEPEGLAVNGALLGSGVGE